VNFEEKLPFGFFIYLWVFWGERKGEKAPTFFEIKFCNKFERYLNFK
jgi:hypothetical protein